MDGPYCRESAAESPKPPPDLPVFVFVAGVEGAGHHALVSVWETLQAHSVALELIVFDQTFHSLGIENHASYHYASIRLEQHFEAMKPIFEKARKNKAIVIDAQNSYPMGAYAGSLAHPDLLYLQEFDGVLYDLRVIALYRDPTDTVLSAVRRFYDEGEAAYKTPEYQARMVSESLVNINNNLPHLPCGKWMMMKYEDFVANPRQFSGPFSRLLKVPKQSLEHAFDRVRRPPSRVEDDMLAKARPVLDDFFNRQKALWPLLAAAAE
jgi:hypothetical protein